jgi:hypothetical protein
MYADCNSYVMNDICSKGKAETENVLSMMNRQQKTRQKRVGVKSGDKIIT